MAPAPSPADEWPGGIAAEVIAYGTIIDPRGDVGRKIGVLSAYDGHAANVGRIVADSTWHHHFDINLRGELGDPTRTGFVTPGTDQWLSSATKIEHYFLNAAIWLASPSKQAAMRFAAWWPVLWSAELVQLDAKTVPIEVLGRAAYDVLGRRAPQCVINLWIVDLVPPLAKRPFFELLYRPDPPPPFIEYLAGVTTRDLMLRFKVGPNSPLPKEPPSQEAFAEVLSRAAVTSIQTLADDLRSEAETMQELARLSTQDSSSE